MTWDKLKELNEQHDKEDHMRWAIEIANQEYKGKINEVLEK